MKVYVAGKITGFDEFKEKFAKAQQELEELGHVVMNPAILPPGFEQDEYMHVCYAMIDVCEGVYFLDNWMDSKCATLEYNYALQNDKWMLFEDSKGMSREWHKEYNKTVWVDPGHCGVDTTGKRAGIPL